MLFVGVDPDMHLLTMAMLYDDSNIPDIAVTRINKSLKGLRALEQAAIAWCNACLIIEPHCDVVLAVEVPDCSYTQRTTMARVGDIGLLSCVAGMAAAGLAPAVDTTYLVHPAQWKKQMPKHIHQPRILKRLGIPFETHGGKSLESQYPVPVDYERYVRSTGKVNPGDWKDINDSLGLALYARDTYRKGR